MLQGKYLILHRILFKNNWLLFLRNFKCFSLHQKNSIKFWECSNHCNWFLYKAVDTKSKLFHLTPLFSSKLFWDFSKKQECNNLVNRWKMTFQVLDSKGKHFLDLVDGDENTLEPFYIKSSSWLKYFGHSNTLCARALRAITNHTPIGEYKLRFFSREEFRCLCGLYPIETRHHILHEYKRFNGYWNLRRDSIGHFILFLELNPNVFAFSSTIY